MKLLRHILVAVDFGPGTECVLRYAAMVAKTFDSQVHLIHVLPDLDEIASTLVELRRAAREGASRLLGEARARLESLAVTVVEATVKEGVPFDQIIRVAEECDVNVILVGAAATSPPHQAHLGTTGLRLSRKSTKPVWIVASHTEVAFRSIVCPVDFSSASRRALRNAIHLSRRFGARLQVVHVSRPPSLLTAFLTLGEEDAEGRRKAAALELDEFLKGFDFHRIDWERRLLEGQPAEAICQTARESQADLLVLGSVGHTGLSHILMGRVATKIAADLPCSMITVKGEDAVRVKIDEELTDLKAHYEHGLELLEHGFSEEARRHFEHCILTNGMFLPAWEALMETYRRLGDERRFEECRQTVERLNEALAWKRIEADIRATHPLWKKHPFS